MPSALDWASLQDGLFLEVRRKLFCNLLRHALASGENFRRQLFAETELVALDAEHGDALRQAIQNMAQAKSLRQAKAMAREMCSMWQLRRTAFPHVYGSRGSTCDNRVNQDHALIMVPTGNQLERAATLNFGWNPKFAQALRD